MRCINIFDNDKSFCYGKLLKLKTQIIDKTKVFREIISKTPQQNKYMTKMLLFANNAIIPIFGHRLYYHLYYSNNNCVHSILPGTKRMFDNGNYGYKYKDWYIPKKYSNIREEIFENKCLNLSLQQWNCCVIKSQLKLQKYIHKINSADLIWEQAYKIVRKSVITIQHIISLLLYTNYATLSIYFCSTFRRQKSNDIYPADIINRHFKVCE